MKNFIQAAFFTIVLGGVAQLFFPWWTVAIVAALVAFVVNSHPAAAYAGGFFAISVLWVGYAALIDFQTQAILTPTIVELLHLPSTSHLFALTSFIGGTTGGMGAVTGNLFRKIFVKERPKY